MKNTDAQTIALLSTGGTISCVTSENGSLVPTVTGKDLLNSITDELAGNISVEVTDLQKLDSSSMTFADIDLIVAACRKALASKDIAGVVITHGTDSLEETALALDVLITDDRPVIVTGAQRPYDDAAPDGPTNLLAAIRSAANPEARGSGTQIVFGGAAVPAYGTSKWHTTDLTAFHNNDARGTVHAVPQCPSDTHLAGTEVAIINAYPGASRALLDAAVAQGAMGLVIEGMGSGNVGSDMAAGIADCLAHNIPVVISTRVAGGPVHAVYGGSGGGATLAELGALSSGSLRSGQARVLLAIALAAGISPEKFFD